MVGPQSRRMHMSRPKPRTLLLFALAAVTTYYLVFSGPGPQFHVVPYLHGKADASTGVPPTSNSIGQAGPDGTIVENAAKVSGTKEQWNFTIDDLNGWTDPDDAEDPDDVEPGEERDGTKRTPGEVGKLQHEKDMRRMWRYAYKTTAGLPTSDRIYGNTMEALEFKDDRPEHFANMLREDPDAQFNFHPDKPVRFNPYPDYNGDDWKKKNYAPYVPCKGVTGELVEDLLVFKGRPRDWPEPKFGGYGVLGMDPNLCWERETRLGPYGLKPQFKKVGGESEVITWDNVNWGDLQRICVHKNAKRYDLNRIRKNEYLNAYPETAVQEQRDVDGPALVVRGMEDARLDDRGAQTQEEVSGGKSGFTPEQRTAVLLRSYTGKEYTENDKQTIRAMITELSLKSGGEYEIFLLVHVKDPKLRIFDDAETYQAVLRDNVPLEFHGMTVLWNDEVVWNIYTELKDEEERAVHTAQWLSVQKFSHDHPQFDFIWNWEMDFRFTGHHYDLVEKLGAFAKKQPRRGLWERNERYYIPSYHGDYDTDFRKDVEERSGNNTVWGPVDLPFIHPVGPRPPTDDPAKDDYIWGVGEEADMITVGPIFNPINSNWVIAPHIWGYSDKDHPKADLPRRTTIVTQSRLSRRLLDIMHVENMRGNHVASEMTPQTVALHHGFKTVFAPHPVFMDRDWNGDFLAQWFNPGDNGESGGYGSPMGWGRERRYQGTTWYYRAEPPNRLYNNWMGWVDTGIGGAKWEQKHGRPCLPSVMLHQVKDSEPTKKSHKSGFDLAYG